MAFFDFELYEKDLSLTIKYPFFDQLLQNYFGLVKHQID